MDYNQLHEFILFVLLLEGKSNIKYYVYRFIFGDRFAMRKFFRVIFQGCDNSTFLHYCNLFKEKYNKNIYIKVEIDSYNLLTGNILNF